MGAAGVGALVAVGADVLGGLGIDQGLQDQRQRLTNQVEVAAGAQCSKQLRQGRLIQGHRGGLLV